LNPGAQDKRGTDLRDYVSNVALPRKADAKERKRTKEREREREKERERESWRPCRGDRYSLNASPP
jgi:hypothetical protein